jgi:hypothetical protein
MPVYSIRIESTSEWNVVEITSAATWARAPGHSIRYTAAGAAVSGIQLAVDDRTIAFGHESGVEVPLTLVVQVATAQDRVALRTDKRPHGVMRLTSATDTRVNDRGGADTNPLDLVLFLDHGVADLAGASGGDPSLQQQ